MQTLAYPHLSREETTSKILCLPHLCITVLIVYTTKSNIIGFDSISGGNLRASERGFVCQAWYARFPCVIHFQNDFFLIRLRQNCPFIFQTLTKFSIFLQPTTSYVSDFSTYSFYHQIKK